MHSVRVAMWQTQSAGPVRTAHMSVLLTVNIVSHNPAQSSSDNLQTITITRMMSSRGEGQQYYSKTYGPVFTTLFGRIGKKWSNTFLKWPRSKSCKMASFSSDYEAALQWNELLNPIIKGLIDWARFSVPPNTL